MGHPAVSLGDGGRMQSSPSLHRVAERSMWIHSFGQYRGEWRT